MAERLLVSARLIERDDGERFIDCDPDGTTGADLDLLLQELGQTRVQMQPPIPAQLPQSGVIVSVPGPGWVVGNSFAQGKALGLRHPAFGWLWFEIPDSMMADIQHAHASVPIESQEGPTH